MSFDINPSKNLSNVQASAKSTPGGGGNTGYFQRGKAEEEEILEFAKDYPEDSFERENVEEITEESFFSILKGLISDVLSAVKNFFSK